MNPYIFPGRASVFISRDLAKWSVFAALLAFSAEVPVFGQTAISFSATAGGGSNWSNSANWTGGVAPADDLTTNIARFNQASYANQPSISSSTRNIAGIQIGSSSAALSIAGLSGTLIIGSSGISMESGASASSVAVTNVSLGANQTWTNSSSNLLTVNVPVAGAFSIEKSGTGALALSGGSYSGGFTLTDGNARINADTAFGTGTLSLNGGVVSTTGASARTIANTITLGGNTQLGIAGTSGIVTFNGNMNVSGNRQISFVNTGGALAGTISLNGDLTLNSEVATLVTGNTLTGIIQDGSSAQGLVKDGSGIIALNGANTYSGGTILNAGQIYAGSASALGTGTVTFGGGTLDLRGQNLVTNALAGSAGSITDTAASGTRVMTVGSGNGSGSYGGTITQSTATKVIAITKTGSGTQKFSGANTYIGQNLINAGTLLINGSQADASASASGVNGYGNSSTGHFEVASGATLGGSGSIKGNSGTANSNLILVKSGGHLAPGDGIGKLTLDGDFLSGTGTRVLNMASGSTFEFQLAGNGGTSDQVAFWNYVSGDVLLNTNTINFTLSGTQVAGSYAVDIFTFFNNNGTTATASGISSGLTLGSLGAGINFASITYGANAISLNYTVAAVPEPKAYALLGLGLAALVLLRHSSRFKA